MTSTINLFRLPYVAMIEVLKNMELGELIEMSRISEKSFNYVHRFFSRKNIGQFKLIVYLSYQFSIGITLVNKTSQGYTECNVNQLSELKTEDLKNMTKLLNYPVVDWKIINVYSKTRSLMALLQSLNLRTDEVTVRQQDANAEMLDDIMKLCTNSKKASVSWKTLENFLLDETLYQPFHLDLLRIRQASWVTVSVVTKLFMNCKKVNINGNKWSPRDVT
ncbi:hypothetical protein GCK72_022927 [Caenorhabditis remanei]|uniref:F-box domain-containing protein n=1 Tax=Caenorhabditis remanei TaxID=31234 RepID=A0A6A5FVM3_CAERE|nr:hypothetical protein GCK72_022927 [Caenorhabditis remanei]KAF1746471.1 hypothetical protein GCK72_022927 [Caenorhabditis remanei]